MYDPLEQEQAWEEFHNEVKSEIITKLKQYLLDKLGIVFNLVYKEDDCECYDDEISFYLIDDKFREKYDILKKAFKIINLVIDGSYDIESGEFSFEFQFFINDEYLLLDYLEFSYFHKLEGCCSDEEDDE